jgi:hypothetical protein
VLQQQLYLPESAKRKADYMLGYTKLHLDAVPTVDFGLTKESYKEGKKNMTNYSYHSMH